MSVTVTPTRGNYSFKVLRDLVLTYNIEPAGMHSSEYQKLIPVGDALWYKRTDNGFIYFIDMDLDVGRVMGASYHELRDSGVLFLTSDWIAPPSTNRDPYIHLLINENGDALARVKR